MNLYDNELYKEDIKSILNQNISIDKLKNSKLLITGSTGLIGTVLVDMLNLLNISFDLNLELYLITRNIEKASEKFNHIKSTKISYIEQDINKPIQTEILFDFIIHGASNTHPSLYSQYPVETLTTNLFGTYNLLEIAKKNPKCRFVLLSSVEIYGEDLSDSQNGLKETDMGYLDCNTVRANYCEGKRASESLCQAYKSQYDVDIVIVRLCRCYGPTLKESDTKALSQFIKNAINKQNIVLKSEGKQYYSYIYSADAASSILFTMLEGINGEAYNVSDKNSNITLKDLAELLANLSNTKVVFDLPDSIESKGFSKSTRAILDSTKLHQLGWHCNYTISTGLQRTLSILKV